MENVYSTIDEALEDLRNGKIILVSDDEDRENEGDLICAAEFATTENVNFMASYAKGLICMPMSKEITNKLNLTQWKGRQGSLSRETRPKQRRANDTGGRCGRGEAIIKQL